jgi:nitroreductase
MDAMHLLIHRNSQAQLGEPGPSDEVLQRMFRAATRAPDHGRLQPWRFLLVRGAARQQLGELFARGLAARRPEATPEEITRIRNAPGRAPLVIVAIARPQPHPKVPRAEQLLAAGCATHGLLLASQALGFGAIWRTGDPASDPVVAEGLGLTADEEIIGFVYVGTPTGPGKPVPEAEAGAMVSEWRGDGTT